MNWAIDQAENGLDLSGHIRITKFHHNFTCFFIDVLQGHVKHTYVRVGEKVSGTSMYMRHGSAK